MKVLFVYPNIVPYPKDISIGISYLSAFLKQHGHETGMIDTTFGMKDAEILERVKDFDPGLIAMSAVSSNFASATRVGNLIKQQCATPIILGGVHATIAPDESIEKDCFDMVCVGEGEYPLLQLVEAMEKGDKTNQIDSIWAKENGTVTKNPVRDLCSNIDDLPYPDLGIYDFATYLQHHNNVASFLGSRGCPYQCRYCVNKFQQKLYKGMGKFVRYRSLEKIIDEIKTVTARFEVEAINFYDDTFTLDKARVKEFCRLYKSEMDLPFHINARIDNLTDDMCRSLSEAGCVRVSVGVESGSPEIRKKVLQRNMSDEKIIEGSQMLKKHGIDLYTYNMIGVPGETYEDIKKTIELNRKIKPDFLAVTIFTAFKGTELYDECKNEGILDEGGEIDSYFRKSNVRHPNFSSRRLNRIRKWFGFHVFIKYDVKRALIELFDRHFITNWAYSRVRSFLVSRFLRKRQEGKSKA